MIDKYKIPTLKQLQSMNQQEFLLYTTKLHAEAIRLRGLLNMIVDKALHEVNTQPNGDDSPYNTILNIAYEGVIE